MLLLMGIASVHFSKQMHQERPTGSGLQHLRPSQCPLVFCHYDWQSELGWVASCLRGADSMLAISKRLKVRVSATIQDVSTAITVFSFFTCQKRIVVLYSGFSDDVKIKIWNNFHEVACFSSVDGNRSLFGLN